MRILSCRAHLFILNHDWVQIACETVKTRILHFDILTTSAGLSEYGARLVTIHAHPRTALHMTCILRNVKRTHAFVVLIETRKLKETPLKEAETIPSIKGRLSDSNFHEQDWVRNASPLLPTVNTGRCGNLRAKGHPECQMLRCRQHEGGGCEN